MIWPRGPKHPPPDLATGSDGAFPQGSSSSSCAGSQEPQLGRARAFSRPLLHEGFSGGTGPHLIPLQTAAGRLSVCTGISPMAGGVMSHEKPA